MLRACFALLVVACLTGGCAASSDRCAPRAPAVTVPTWPPAPLPEIVTAAPAPGMTRIAGYFHWDGLRWVWVPGHWVTPPPGQRWAPARTVSVGDGVAFHPGEMTCARRDDEDAAD